MSPWLVLTNSSDPYKKVFIKKDDIEHVSTITVDGTSTTVITATIRGKQRAISVLESTKQIFSYL